MRFPWFRNTKTPVQSVLGQNWIQQYFDIHTLYPGSYLQLTQPILDNRVHTVMRISKDNDMLPKIVTHRGTIATPVGGTQIFHRTAPHLTETHFFYTLEGHPEPDLTLIIKGYDPQTVSFVTPSYYPVPDTVLMLVPNQPPSDWVKS